ncbi:MAG: hypothetical protein GY816_10035 [Cytophagales bacterium]|nr:hypothetical protein [Cytophagales bacterium]
METTKYFYRNVMFSKNGKKISLIDIYNPDAEAKELEPWLGLVLQLADGQHTIDELFQYMANLYNGNPPPNLDDTVRSVVDRMVKSKFIVLTEKATELPYYLSLPYELMDVEKAIKLIEKDKVQSN